MEQLDKWSKEMKLRNLLELLSHEPQDTELTAVSMSVVKDNETLHIALDKDTGILHLNREKHILIEKNNFVRNVDGVIL